MSGVSSTNMISSGSARPTEPPGFPTWGDRFRRWEDAALRQLAVGIGRVSSVHVAQEAVVLAYHRVCPEFRGPQRMPTWSVTPKRLEEQILGLLGAGFVPRRVSDLVMRSREGRPLGPREFAVTFDDGYASVLAHAMPILQRLAIPATLMLVTAWLDCNEPFPADDWSGAGAPNVPRGYWRGLTSRECDALLDTGLIDIGSHSHTHLDFRSSPESFRDDLANSIELLRGRFGVDAPAFSFPYGSARYGFCKPQLSAIVRDIGMSCGFSLEPMAIRVTDDRYSWGRIPVHGLDTPHTLLAKVNGWYGKLRSFWRAMTGPFRPHGPAPFFPPPNWWRMEQEVVAR